MSLLLAAFHEAGLNMGLGKWILNEGPRDDLISANREGLVSGPGFLAIYFAGISYGVTIFKPKRVVQDYFKELKCLGISCKIKPGFFYYINYFHRNVELSNVGIAVVFN